MRFILSLAFAFTLLYYHPAVGIFSTTDPTILDVTTLSPDSEGDIGEIGGGSDTNPSVNVSVRAGCRCGASSVKVVGGSNAKISDYPWTVGIVSAKKGVFGDSFKMTFCGGSLINNLYVVTAAHCVEKKPANSIQIWLNEENILIATETPGGRIVANVEEITVHPDYKQENGAPDNDIALIRLASPVALAMSDEKTNIYPVCLPPDNENKFVGAEGTVIGWGTTSPGGLPSYTLQKVEIPIISNEMCANETINDKQINDNMLCAGALGKGSCHGDSGGPFVVNVDGKYVLAGVVSWGIGCVLPNTPGVYTRVGRYVPWIMENVKGAEWCEG